MEMVGSRQRERCGGMPPAAVPTSTSAALPSCTIVCQVGHCLAFLTAKRGVLGVILLAAEGIFPGLNLMRGESQPAEPGLGLSEMASAGGQ